MNAAHKIAAALLEHDVDVGELVSAHLAATEPIFLKADGTANAIIYPSGKIVLVTRDNCNPIPHRLAHGTYTWERIEVTGVKGPFFPKDLARIREWIMGYWVQVIGAGVDTEGEPQRLYKAGIMVPTLQQRVFVNEEP